MRISNKPRFLLITLILSLFLFTSFATFSSQASPNGLVIDTSNIILGKVYYDNFSMVAKKLTSANGIGYCLQINKDYPHSEIFTNQGTVNYDIENILACGYPNRSPKDLNLPSEEDAYFATQIAIWSYIEGYDTSKITGDRPEIITAINTIYNNSLTLKNVKLNYDTNLFFTADSIQHVVILSINISESLPISDISPIIDESNIIPGK
ncbi:thioester domain-containing protein [Clostridium gasigenes]|uniref:thioester domain-containing protein n=1 Tax=Clostridium gasigenes TaxID=94869 RepID=UPI001C0D3573|nr:thioester domain-containing protein [Clostridium gasigenes]MBU3104792.1 thioester domain-containing protein [Clostridium gasigenes]